MQLKQAATGILTAAILLAFGCSQTHSVGQTAATKPAAPIGKTTVVWVSQDGFRHDYPDRVPAPFYHKLMAEGASTRDLIPIFPSITFASHSTEATGVGVDKHGIPVNSFFAVDRPDEPHYSFPQDSTLLMAEPIWITAQKQGVPTAVLDWPLSQAQQGPVTAQIFNPGKFDGKLSDEQRLDLLATTYEQHPELRLVIGYIEATDVPGHKFGPDAPQIAAKITEDDGLLSAFFDRVKAVWDAHHGPGDRLYFLLTTDHGMVKVTNYVNLANLLKLKTDPDRAEILNDESGSIANVYIKPEVTGDQRAAIIQRLVTNARTEPHLVAYRRTEMPARWMYNNPARVGDVVISLKAGYTFSHTVPKILANAEQFKGVKGMHGYDPAETPDMHGCMFVWCSTPITEHQLGNVSTLQIEPTVAGWLGVQPPADVTGKPFLLPQ
jgi:hypothetical protein